MKKCVFSLIVAAIAVMFAACANLEIKSDGLDGCQDVCCVDDTLFATNMATSNPLDYKSKEGSVVAVVSGEAVNYLAPDGSMSVPKGIAAIGNYIYVADFQRVHVINRTTKHKFAMPLPSEDYYANDIVVVGDMLLLSVTNNGHILALDLNADGSPQISGFQLLTTVIGASAMCYATDRLFIASYSDEPANENVLYVIDNFDLPEAKVFLSRQGGYRGLTADDQYLYFSDVNINTLGRVSLTDTADVSYIETPHSAPSNGIVLCENTIFATH